jgi:hypothetical protein
MGSKKAFIFGPFIGELYWEAYRFAPYAISLKKRFPKHHLIVFTRPSRFDLYGRYASIFIPLIIDDEVYKKEKFTLKNFYVNEYQKLCKNIKSKYSNLYRIVDHYAPQIEGFMYRVKWQYPRAYMEYDYHPRFKNVEIVNKMYGDLDNVIMTNDQDIELENYNVITNQKFFVDVKAKCSENSSPLGCLIHLLKTCDFVISNFDDNLARFAVLCGVTVITVKEKFTDDAIHLMNPLKSTVIKCQTVEEGVKKYEDYFRS